MPPIMGQYSKPHTKAWAAKIGSFDAYVFVTPEYNHGTSGALKNAIDFLFAEWNNKAAGFVSYGGASGARAVEQLRLNLAEVRMATVRHQVLSPCIPISETSAVSNRIHTKKNRSMRCWTSLSRGEAH